MVVKTLLLLKDEDSAKRAIRYLKDNRLGRATFYPLSVIRERYIDDNSLNTIKNNSDFVGVMSDLVSFNREFNNVITNQLGTVVVATNIDAATRISHMIRAKYKVVTLEGDVINVGGSLTGGSTYNGKSVIILKQELKHLEDTLNILKQEESEIQNELMDNSKEITLVEEELFDVSREKLL